jgi:hypothetical protein
LIFWLKEDVDGPVPSHHIVRGGASWLSAAQSGSVQPAIFLSRNHDTFNESLQA